MRCNIVSWESEYGEWDEQVDTGGGWGEKDEKREVEEIMLKLI